MHRTVKEIYIQNYRYDVYKLMKLFYSFKSERPNNLVPLRRLLKNFTDC